MGILDKVKDARQERKEGFGFKAVAQYLGGHPDILKQTSGNITTLREGLSFKEAWPFKGNLLIPYDEITAVDSDTAEHLSLGRMLFVGILAFAWKKKEKFLKITYKDKTGFDSSVVFGKLNADEWRGVIVRARQSFVSFNQ